MKNFRLVLIVILTAIILTACGPAAEPAADEPIEIVIWNTWSDHHVEAFQKLLDDFNEKHPNITVVQQPQPLADYEAKVMQAVREGKGPDIINSFPTNAANYVDEGLIVNLSKYIDDPEIGIPGFKESYRKQPTRPSRNGMVTFICCPLPFMVRFFTITKHCLTI